MEEKYKPTDLAYMAGLFDGDGSLSVAHSRIKNRDYYSIKFLIYNANESCLKWVKDILGYGNIVYRHDGRVNHAGNYYYIIHKQKEIVNALVLLFPYLRIKSFQASKAIDYLDSRLKARETHRNNEIPYMKAEKSLLQDIHNENARYSMNARQRRVKWPIMV